MKKKLEAELMSIAHRILKLKNRAELDQLQQETLKLYEKLSVLKFVEDHYSGAEPTIGRASALGTLEEVYGIEEAPSPKGGKEAEAPVAESEETDVAEEAKAGTEKEGEITEEEPAEETVAEDKEEEPETETEEAVEEEAPVADGEESEVDEAESPPAPKGGEETPETEEPKAEIEKPELPKVEQPEHQEPEEEPEVKVQVEKPEEVVKAEEDSAKAVFEKEIDATEEEEEKAADAEMQTIAPDPETKVEPSNAGFEFAYERKPVPEEPVKQKEISFEDFHDYKEPEFVKKSPPAPKGGEEATELKGEQAPEPKVEEAPQQPEPVRDWRDWEPSTSPYGQKKEEPKPVEPKPLNAALGNAITLGLNDRIAFEKHLFGGSADDLNRVISQLNTLNSFEEAQNFIADLVKPDYNNWANKEEYEERFMAIVERRFS